MLDLFGFASVCSHLSSEATSVPMTSQSIQKEPSLQFAVREYCFGVSAQCWMATFLLAMISAQQVSTESSWFTRAILTFSVTCMQVPDYWVSRLGVG